MTFRILILLSLIIAGHQAYTQQMNDRIAAAEEHYHDATRAYLNGDNERAERTAESGLTADPDNQKLRDLLELIRQQQNPSGGSGDDDKENEQDDSEESDEQSPSDSEQNDSEQGNPGSDQNPADSPPEEQSQAGGSSDSPPSEEQPQDGRMSRAEAARLLDAIGADERLFPESIRDSPERNPEKDW